MLKSMTGFGRATVETTTLNVIVEIKSLNSKFLDVFCKMPRTYSEREIEVRNLITQRLERGKVEFMLNVTPIAASNAGTAVNKPVVKAYYKDLAQTAHELSFEPNATDLLRIAMQMPNVYITDTADETQQTQDWADILGVVKRALDKCEAFRVQEGRVVASMFEEAITKIGDLLNAVEALDQNRIPSVRERLQKAVKDLLGNEQFDPNRFEQELVYYIEKFDISEEKTRLQAHLKYFVETLNAGQSNGKKLNFIAQEIGREINTIGSKANDAAIQRLVVQMKDELEKIKEQTANVI